MGRTLARVAPKASYGCWGLYEALVRLNEKGADFSKQSDAFFKSIHPPLTESKYFGNWLQCEYNFGNLNTLFDQTKLYFPLRSLAPLRPLVQQLVDEKTPFVIKFSQRRRVDNAIVWVDPSAVSALVDQLRSQPHKSNLAPFLVDTSQKDTELISDELAFVPRLLPNLNVHVSRELGSSYMQEISQLVERFLEQTEVVDSWRELLERASSGDDKAATALAHAFFDDSFPFLKFEAPDSAKREASKQFAHAVMLASLQCIQHDISPLDPTHGVTRIKHRPSEESTGDRERRDARRRRNRAQRVAVAVASLPDEDGCDQHTDVAATIASLEDMEGVGHSTADSQLFAPWTPLPHIMSLEEAKAYCRDRGYTGHTVDKLRIFMAEALRAGLLYQDDDQADGPAFAFDTSELFLKSPAHPDCNRLYTTADPAGLLRLLELARDVGGVEADGQWARLEHLDRGLLQAGAYTIGSLNRMDNWRDWPEVLWRTQDSGAFNLEHWLSEKLYGDWDYDRAYQEALERHATPWQDRVRSEPLKKLYEKLYGADGRAPDEFVPRCVVCRQPLLRAGEKQAVVSFDRRQRRHVVSKGVLLSKMAAGKRGSVFAHAACSLSLSTPVFDILLDKITAGWR